MKTHLPDPKAAFSERIAELEASIQALEQDTCTFGDEFLHRKLIEDKRKTLAIMKRLTNLNLKCYCNGKGTYIDPHAKRGFCHCETGVAARTKWEDEHPQRMASRARSLWQSFGFPLRANNWTLSQSPLVRTHPKQVKRILEQFTAPEARIQDVPSLYISGPCGCGKTGLAVVLAQHFTKRFAEELRPGSVVFVTAADMLARFRSSYGQGDEAEQDVLERYLNASLLLLDDLGSQYTRELDWLAEKLYQVLGGRHLHMMPTVITSNLPFKVIHHRVGDRVAWRIRESCGDENIITLQEGVKNARLDASHEKTAPTTGVENHRQGTDEKE